MQFETLRPGRTPPDVTTLALGWAWLGDTMGPVPHAGVIPGPRSARARGRTLAARRALSGPRTEKPIAADAPAPA